MRPGYNWKAASLLVFRQKGETGVWPGETIVQRSAKFCPIPCHDLRLTFQSELEYLRRDLTSYSFREYLDAENSLDTNLSSGLWCAQAASSLAPGCGRKNLPPNSPASSMRFAVANSAFDSSRFGALPSRRGLGHCQTSRSGSSGLPGSVCGQRSIPVRCRLPRRQAGGDVPWLPGSPGIGPAFVRAPLGAWLAPGGNSLFCFGSTALRVTVSREILLRNRREKISPDPP
jgi:hypothetical protein